MRKQILLLGNVQLYEISKPIKLDELSNLKPVIEDLHDTLMAFKEKYHAGRAIAAPQIGIKKRLIYMFIDKPIIFVNPFLTFPDTEKITVLDDCMSFPNLFVKVKRYNRCNITYFDLAGRKHTMELTGDLSELIQHEYDHLDGILATMRAIDNRSFILKSAAGDE